MSQLDEVNLYLKELEKTAEGVWNQPIQVQDLNRIPPPEKLRLEVPRWYRINNVVSVYADMIGSTQLNTANSRSVEVMGRVYEAFVSNAVRIFHAFNAEVIEIQGDGILAIWSGKSARYPAIAGAVSAKTFVGNWLKSWAKKQINVDIGVHIGIDEFKSYVKYVGMRGDQKNEVWAGEPVSISSKLCSLAIDDELIVTHRLYEQLKLQVITHSCGCIWDDGKRVAGEKSPLWQKSSVDELRQREIERLQLAEEVLKQKESSLSQQLGINDVWILKSTWCEVHGNEFCREIMKHWKDD